MFSFALVDKIQKYELTLKITTWFSENLSSKFDFVIYQTL
jgi:hypothetical protein